MPLTSTDRQEAKQSLTSSSKSFRESEQRLVGVVLDTPEVVGSPQQRTDRVQLMCWCLTGLPHVQVKVTNLLFIGSKHDLRLYC